MQNQPTKTQRRAEHKARMIERRKRQDYLSNAYVTGAVPAFLPVPKRQNPKTPPLTASDIAHLATLQKERNDKARRASECEAERALQRLIARTSPAGQLTLRRSQENQDRKNELRWRNHINGKFLQWRKDWLMADDLARAARAA